MLIQPEVRFVRCDVLSTIGQEDVQSRIGKPGRLISAFGCVPRPFVLGSQVSEHGHDPVRDTGCGCGQDGAVQRPWESFPAEMLTTFRL
jgi:hypothetical protein